jgi:hypothetical protein
VGLPAGDLPALDEHYATGERCTCPTWPDDVIGRLEPSLLVTRPRWGRYRCSNLLRCRAGQTTLRCSAAFSSRDGHLLSAEARLSLAHDNRAPITLVSPGSRSCASYERSRLVQRLHHLDGVGLARRLVRPVPDHPRKAKRHATGITGRGLDAVEGDLHHHLRA